MKASKVLAVSGVMAVVLAALMLALRGPYARLAAEHWRQQLDCVADERAPDLLEQMAALGEPGIAGLVAAIGSPRESVACAGRQVLLAELGRWQTLGAEEHARRQALLAEALASRVDQFGPTARGTAADVAAQILLNLPGSEAGDRNPTIDSCRKVLQAAADRQAASSSTVARPRRVAALRSPAPESGGDAPSPGSSSSDSLPPQDLSAAELPRLPGGGLPIQPLAPPEIEKGGAAATAPESAQASPKASVPQQAPLQQIGKDAAAEASRPAGASAFGASNLQRSTAAASESDVIQTSSLSEPAASAELAAVETIDLMRWLHAEDKPTLSKAEAELSRRGFTPVHLELARRLFDRRAEVRKELARLLPGLRSVDAAPWLLCLARDQDAEVRLTAITLAATSGDPALLREVEQLARQDADPRIQRQAERLSQRHNENPRK